MQITVKHSGKISNDKFPVVGDEVRINVFLAGFFLIRLSLCPKQLFQTFKISRIAHITLETSVLKIFSKVAKLLVNLMKYLSLITFNY